MKVLVIGGGGREHALCWALRQSARVTDVVCAPGNAGIAAIATCIPVLQDDVADMLRVVEQTQPRLVVVGPEVPLAAGIVDALQERGIRTFGPTQAAAQLESSKAFTKDFLQRHNIPTARYRTVHTLDEAHDALQQFSVPIVVKADGLAAGKGVVIAGDHAEAAAAVLDLLPMNGSVVIEEFLEGDELSFFALCDGTHAVAIAAAQDHKRIGEGDTGPNTGGMGAYSTDALLPDDLRAWLLKHVAQPTVDGMRAEGIPFKGILFCGIMMTPAAGLTGESFIGGFAPKVLEFNTRWGDPETQAILLRMETDLLDLVNASIDGTADEISVKMKPGASMCVILASAGYPASAQKGVVIHGLDDNTSAGVEIFHSGTATDEAGETVTAGGRVLGITAQAENLRRAAGKAYDALAAISFQGMQYRRDIGWRALDCERNNS
ncbi:phosphoribosylamine--glycine ligase [Terriglobus roseus DSM 18391]|uniref:Phosphoribosylamine--glycine ligase n=1 Tax=Terriglobus roseus (strain DSM 18391 / NRRL B-41598 / KBS 63) TaxID=926566 RepID=I3ZBS0_TERRK|nr:phosphoribosylamine--glycine ligase [Terriglobus roseus]AFL86688.1 phosphoribosylamine--glycine ligase [Terriglobus roseus DSM 18391]